MVYRIDNRPNKHKGRNIGLGILFGIILTVGVFVMVENNTQPIIQKVVDIKTTENIPIRIHYFVNQARQQEGLKPYFWSDDLMMIAQKHSQEMASNNDLTHSGMFDRLQEVDCINGNENISKINGYTDEQIPQIVVNDWLNSYGHHANVMNPKFTTEGIGVATNGYQIYITEELC